MANLSLQGFSTMLKSESIYVGNELCLEFIRNNVINYRSLETLGFSDVA